MGIFQADFATVDAGFPVYEKGMYRVKVSKRTPFVRESEDRKNPGTTKISAGVRYGLEMFGRLDEESGEYIATDENGKEIRGKTVSAPSVYLHSEGARSFSKLFFMAILGFSLNEENEFNSWSQEHKDDFAFSGEAEDSTELLEENLGDGWDAPLDRFVNVYMKKVPNMDGSGFDQEFSAWQPVGERVEL